MFPEQAIKAAVDLNTKYLIPIHWGAFRLASHAWTEPLEIVSRESANFNQNFIIPEIGQVLIVDKENKTVASWWRGFSQAN